MSADATVAAATTTTEATEQPKSFDERLMETVEANVAKAQGDAQESTAEETDETTEAETAAETTEGTKEAETEKKTEEPAPEPFTAEQMRDPKFFDRLDKEGWARLEKLHPALYEMGKAVASARGKAFQELQTIQKSKPAVQEEPTKPSKMSPEMRAAWKRAQSLDEDEAMEGLAEYNELVLRQSLPKLGFDPDAAQMNATLTSAYQLAVEGSEAEGIEAMPELHKLETEELEAVVEKSPRMLRTLKAAGKLPNEERRAVVAVVMQEAGSIVIANRKAAKDAADVKAKAEADKKAATQKRLKSNESNASLHVVDNASGKATKGAKSFDKDGMEFIEKQLAAGAPKA